MNLPPRIVPPSPRLAQLPPIPLQQLLIHSPDAHLNLITILLRAPPIQCRPARLAEPAVSPWSMGILCYRQIAGSPGGYIGYFKLGFTCHRGCVGLVGRCTGLPWQFQQWTWPAELCAGEGQEEREWCPGVFAAMCAGACMWLVHVNEEWQTGGGICSREHRGGRFNIPPVAKRTCSLFQLYTSPSRTDNRRLCREASVFDPWILPGLRLLY